MPHPRAALSRWLRMGPASALLIGAIALPAAALASRSADPAAVASATAMPFQVVVPGLAAGTAAPLPITTPTAVPNSAVAITGTSVSNTNGDGTVTNLTVWGNVHNGLDHAIGDVQLSATATDAGGSVLATGAGTARLDVIPAGGDAPFSVPLEMVTDLSTTVSVAITNYTDLTTAPAKVSLTTSVQPPQPFKIGMKDPKTGFWPDSPNLLAANGAVTNSGSTAERINSVVVSFEDSTGEVWLVAVTDVFAANFPGADPQV
ncbi:MAG: hypothetical protein ACRDG3_03835, partial [Tepidiformaceae bacterium]